MLTTLTTVPIEPCPGEMEGPPHPMGQLSDYWGNCVHQQVGELLRVRSTFTKSSCALEFAEMVTKILYKLS